MTPALSKLNLTVHVSSSVGWFGAVAGFLALAIAGLTSRDVQLVRAAYLSMNLIAWFVIVPFAFASLLTGIIQSLGTEWGFFRHYWVLTKLMLTVFATIVLLTKMALIGQVAGSAAERAFAGADYLRQARIGLLVHAGGGLLVLLMAATLSIYKPWGLTSYGERRRKERREAVAGTRMFTAPTNSDSGQQRTGGDAIAAPLKIFLAVVGVLAAVIVVLHLAGGAHGSHGH